MPQSASGREYDVFLSYSHENLESALQIITLLEQHGYSFWWDRSLFAGDDWLKQIQLKIGSSRKVLVLWSNAAVTSKYVFNEAATAIAEDKLVPYCIEPCSVPPEFSHIQAPPLPDVATGRSTILGALGPPQSVERQARTLIDQPKRVHVSGLPTTVSVLVGRASELELLRAAWVSGDDRRGTQKTNIVVLVAMGGAGKTALLRAFLERMRDQEWAGANLVYAWSAYEQGAHENSSVSADQFFHSGLKWFGYDIDRQPLTTPEEKAYKLAELIQRKRTLLILDGIEPLQHLPTVHRGRVRDRGLQVFLEQLAQSNPGLCVVTTRQPIVELGSVASPTVISHDLQRLDQETGIKLLRQLGVWGSREQMTEACERVGGHALCITLLGTYLDSVYGGDVTKAFTAIHEIFDPRLSHEIAELGVRTARRVMDSYLRRFAELSVREATGEGKPEIAFLTVLGLSDRPLEAGALAALLDVHEPSIDGITTPLMGVSPQLKAVALKRLRALGLVSPTDQDRPGTIDAHPLVKDYFGETLKATNPISWKAAHRRLYQYYRRLPERAHPNTLEEMEPLFVAVRHACFGGLHQDAWTNIYLGRMNRSDSEYITKTLGAFGAGLAALSAFFESPWNPDTVLLQDRDKRQLLTSAGFQLRAVGRLAEAKPLFAAAHTLASAAASQQDMASSLGLLSEAELLTGNIDAAIRFAEDALVAADAIPDQQRYVTLRITRRASLARALHQNGQLALAEKLFREAAHLQLKTHPDAQQLYGISGYYFCDLLLDKGDRKSVANAAEHSLAKETRPLLIALATLLRARAAVSAGLAQPLKAKEIESHLADAIEKLRRTGNQEFLVDALLCRADFWSARGDAKRAERDLRESRDIATYSDLKLAAVDYRLAEARIAVTGLAPPNRVTAPRRSFFSIFTRRATKPTVPAKDAVGAVRSVLAEAHAEIMQSGYLRRMSEWESLNSAVRLLRG